MQLTFVSQNYEDTLRFGFSLGELLQPGSVVGLEGDLGAGKTCFIKGIARGSSGVPESDVTSPTFAILHEYTGPVPVYHFDAYRLESSDDLEAVGFDDYVYGDGIVVVEWADRITDALPDECLYMKIEVMDEQRRRFECRAFGRRYDMVLRSFQTAVSDGGRP